MRFMSSSGTLVSADDSEWARAEKAFFSALANDQKRLCRYQLQWLHTKYPKRLGNDLAGPVGEGRQASFEQAVRHLQALMGPVPRDVIIPQGFMPITEGTVTFDTLKFRFLPWREPTLFLPSEGRHKTLTQLVDEGRSLWQAVNKIMSSIEER